jgi:hypothetical protein
MRSLCCGSSIKAVHITVRAAKIKPARTRLTVSAAIFSAILGFGGTRGDVELLVSFADIHDSGRQH